MKRVVKIFTLFALMISSLFIVTSCDDDKYEIALNNFNTTIKYKSEVNLDELKLKNITSGELVSITSDMITDNIDTTKVGKDKLVIAYNEQTYEVEVNIKYEIVFNVNNELTTQYITDISELDIPNSEDLNTDSQEFIGFTPTIPSTITDNSVFTANFLNISKDIPALEDLYEVEYLDNSSSIKLPENTSGKWVIEDDIVFDEIKEYKLKVKFIPNDDSYTTKEDEITVNVNKKKINLDNVVDTVTYNGQAQKIQLDIPSGLEVNEQYNFEGVSEENLYPVNAGEYEYLIEVIGNEYYEGTVIEGIFTINKADVTINLPNINKSFTYPNNTVEITLDEILNHEDFTINTSFKVTEELINSFNFTLEKTTYNEAGSFNYTLNYENDNFNITFNEAYINIAKGNIDQSLVNNPIIEAEFGDLLSDINITNDSDLGKFVPKTPEVMIDQIGLYKAVFVFIPNNELYNSFEREIEFEVSKKVLNLEDYLVENIFDYDGTAKNIIFDFGNYEEYLTVEGNEEHTNAGIYKLAISINSENFIGDLNINLIINKINPEFEVPTKVFNAYITKTYDSVEFTKFDNGTLTLLNPKNTFTAFKTLTLEAVFTPNDTTNYNSIPCFVTVNVQRMKATINVDYQKEYIANNNNKISYSLNHGETKISQTIQIQVITVNNQGKEQITWKTVNDFEAEGIYQIILSAPQTAHYEAVEKTIKNIKVLPKTPILPGEEIVTFYGNKLKNIIFKETELGTWSWKNPEEVINAIGKQKYIAVFTSTDGQTHEQEVEITVVKQKIDFNITKSTFVYDGKEHKLEYNLPHNDLKVLGDESYINAGLYEVTLTIESDYYEGSITHYIEITKAHDEYVLGFEDFASFKVDNGDVLELDNYANFDYTIKATASKFDFDQEFDLLINGLSYIDNPITKAGSYTINIRSKGNLDNEEIIFTINLYNVLVSRDIMFKTADRFFTLAEALEATKDSKETVYVHLLGSDTLTNDLTNNYVVGKNVILYIPHEVRTFYIEYNMKSDLGEKIINNNYIKDPLLFTTLVIEDDVTLTIEGKVEVGANRSQAQPIVNHIGNAYSKITNNGNIIVNGLLYVAGIIDGEGTIEAKKGSKLYELFQIKDWRGGTNAAGVYGITQNDKSLAPFADYRMRSIECKTIYNYGSSLIGIASIFASSTWTSAEYPFIGEKAILEMLDEDASVIKYLSDEIIEMPQKNASGATINNHSGLNQFTNKMVFELSGNIKDNAGKLKVSIATVDTGKVLLGIGYNAKIIVKENAEFSVNAQYKLLPDADIIIEKNAVVNLNNNVIIYDKWNDVGYNGTNYYPHEMKPARLINNGTININDKGALAGIVLSETEGAIINTSTKLQITSYEGWSNVKLAFKPNYTTTAIITKVLQAADNSALEANSTYVYNGTTFEKQ